MSLTRLITIKVRRAINQKKPALVPVSLLLMLVLPLVAPTLFVVIKCHAYPWKDLNI